MQQSLFEYTPPQATSTRPIASCPVLPHGHPTTIATIMAAITTSRDVYDIAFERDELRVMLSAVMLRRYLATFRTTDRLTITIREDAITIAHAGGVATMQHGAWITERKPKLPSRRDRFATDYEARHAAALADFAKREAKAVRTIHLV